ncbi:hypothetical protein [Lacticaseibacillus chiayiensis]|uniref:hypothetical protein n=1 Tax=Lacticaseibacillus chiayiensis TaxID=2100821 RepID=UPI0017839F6F|nr:hypothetical protein [Lacticaseibacillus chiayiensis]QVI33921.1 hypothetical protein KG086_08920 [Lacticaseibacillus chiayiensis]
MSENPDIVQVKLDQGASPRQSLPASKTLQIRVNNHETVIVYNRKQSITARIPKL